MVMSPAGLETMNDCAGENQQQFTRPEQLGIFRVAQQLLVYEEGLSSMMLVS
jgi:hypothetical protein